MASAIIPGAGQWMLGARIKAAVMLTCFLAGALFWLIFRVPQYYWGMMPAIWSLFLLQSWSASNALRLESEHALRASRLWIPVAILFSLCAGTSLHANWMLRASGYRSFNIPSTSMKPALMLGDKMIVDLRAFRSKPPKQGDIAIYNHNGTYFVKRVIAVGDDVISSKGGVISLNGKELQEPYVIRDGSSGIPAWMNDFGPTRIPQRKFFVMGDNRDVSLDSRSPNMGFIDRSEFYGKPIYLYGPYGDRMGSRIQ